MVAAPHRTALLMRYLTPCLPSADSSSRSRTPELCLCHLNLAASMAQSVKGAAMAMMLGAAVCAHATAIAM